jgi:hypothetical protein
MHGQHLADQLAPTHHTLFGLGGADKIDALFDATALTLAALCPTSLLLTQLGRHKSLPADLFIVLPNPHALRIVVLKERMPVLTRLVPVAGDAAQQAEEIVRTHRYLENTRILPRGVNPPPTLILGDSSALAAPLAAARFQLLAPPPPWNRTPPADWRFPLFDLAVDKQPFGQLAPTHRRTVHLAQRLRHFTRNATIFSLLSGLIAAGFNVNEIRAARHEQSQNQNTTERMNRQLTELSQHGMRFSADKDLMQRVLTLHQDEILATPSFDRQLRQIAEALTGSEGIGHVRLARLEWHLLAPGAIACEKWRTPPQTDAQNPAPPTTPETSAALTVDTPASARRAEIQFELQLPASPPRLRLETLRHLSTRLQALEGVQLISDPSVQLNKETLRGGAQAESSDKPPVVCLTLPGKAPHKEANPS